MNDIDNLRWAAAKAQLELLGCKYGMTVPEKNYRAGKTFAWVPYLSGGFLLAGDSEGRVRWDHYTNDTGKTLEERLYIGDLEEGIEEYDFWRRKVFDNFPPLVREQYERKLLDELWVYIWTLADNMASGEGPALAAAYLASVVFQKVTFTRDHDTREAILRLKSSTTGDYYGNPILVSQLVKHCTFGSELTQWIIETAYAVFNGKEYKENKDEADEDARDSELP